MVKKDTKCSLTHLTLCFNFILCHSEKSYDKSCLCSINDVTKISQYF